MPPTVRPGSPRRFYYPDGSTPLSFLEDCGVLFQNRRAQVDDFGETNIPRLFLAGDLAMDNGTILTAFNSGDRVAVSVVQPSRQ